MENEISYEYPFKIGDKVTIIAPPEDQKRVTPKWLSFMDEYIGHTGVVTWIKPVPAIDAYILHIDGYGHGPYSSIHDTNWRDSWLLHTRETYTLF